MRPYGRFCVCVFFSVCVCMSVRTYVCVHAYVRVLLRQKKNRAQASYFTQVTQNLKDDTNFANIWFEIECKVEYNSSSRLLNLTSTP